MVKTLEAGPWTFDLMVRVQTDSFLMPIEDATSNGLRNCPRMYLWRGCDCRASVLTPPSSPRLRTSCATTPGIVGRAQTPGKLQPGAEADYWELARLHQAMNQVEHIEPTGEERFPA